MFLGLTYKGESIHYDVATRVACETVDWDIRFVRYNLMLFVNRRPVYCRALKPFTVDGAAFFEEADDLKRATLIAPLAAGEMHARKHELVCFRTGDLKLQMQHYDNVKVR